MHTQERTFRTESTPDAAHYSTMRVDALKCRVKKLTCTDEGKLTLAIEATAEDDAALERVRDLILIQQGEVTMTLDGVRGEPLQ